MTTELIKLTRDTVTLLSDTPGDIGTGMGLEIKLPGGILLESFGLSGTIVRCQSVTYNESSAYMLEVKIGDISPMNKKILDAYIDFIERENMLKDIKVDFKALEDVISDFGEKLKQLGKTSELLNDNLKGTLELLMRNLGQKATIH